MVIYKIMTAAAWRDFKQSGVFEGAAIDIADGYIHFSTVTQVKETAAKHFAGQTDLMIVTAETDTLGDDIRWEMSRGGSEFPHLYRAWQLSEVTGQFALPWDGDAHQFPDGF